MRETSRKPILTNRRVVWLAGIATFVALLAFFVADNFVLTEVRLFTVTFQVRLAWVEVIAYASGAFGGGLVARFWRR